jgi:HK97 family phage portal protein
VSTRAQAGRSASRRPTGGGSSLCSPTGTTPTATSSVGSRTRGLKEDRGLALDSTLHSAWWSPLGKLGISPLRKLGTTLRIEDAAQQWAQNKLGRGFTPTGVVELDDRFLGLEEPERQTLYDVTAKRFRDAYGGFARAGEVPILPPGVKWHDATPTTAVEAQLIDQRKLNREESAAVYQLPPPMIGILDRATYSNITTLRQVAYTDGLAPPLVMIEAGINVVVCVGLLREPDLFVEHDFGGVLRGDKLKEIQAIREAVSTAVLTPNEGRDMQGRPRSENPAADELYIPANNLKPLGSGDQPKKSRRRRR